MNDCVATSPIWRLRQAIGNFRKAEAVGQFGRRSPSGLPVNQILGQMFGLLEAGS
jgi:hypothetical protein